MKRHEASNNRCGSSGRSPIHQDGASWAHSAVYMKDRAPPDFRHTRSVRTAKLLSAFANHIRPRSRTLPKARHTFFVPWRGCAKPQRREQSCSCCLACCKWRTCFDGTVTAAAGPRANGSPSGSSKPCLIPQLVQASDGRLLLISLPGQSFGLSR